MDILKDIDDTEKEIRILKDELSKKYDGEKIKIRYRNQIKDAQIHGIIEESVNYRAYLILVKFDDIKTPVAYNEQQFAENIINDKTRKFKINI